MKIAAYTRVSTSLQSTDNQLPAIEQWVKTHDAELVMLYSENESAWKAGHQKELSRLLNDVRSGKRKYDVLLVWALDRLSRGGSAAILNLVDIFKTYGIKVISIQESWTEAPGIAGEIMYAIVGWVARMESERRSKRTKAGLARALREGKHLGRPKGSKDKNKRNRGGYLLRYHKPSNKGAVAVGSIIPD